MDIENDPEKFLELLDKYYHGKFQFRLSKKFNKNIFHDEINFLSFMWTGLLLFYIFSIKKGISFDKDKHKKSFKLAKKIHDVKFKDVSGLKDQKMEI